MAQFFIYTFLTDYSSRVEGAHACTVWLFCSHKSQWGWINKLIFADISQSRDWSLPLDLVHVHFISIYLLKLKADVICSDSFLQLSDEIRLALHLLGDDNSSIVAIFLICLSQPQQDNSFRFRPLSPCTILIFVILLFLTRAAAAAITKKCLHLCYTRVISVYWCSFF